MLEFTVPKYFVLPVRESDKLTLYFWNRKLKVKEHDYTYTYSVEETNSQIFEKVKAILIPEIEKFEKLSDHEKQMVWYNELDRIEEEERQEMIEEKHWKWMHPHI